MFEEHLHLLASLGGNSFLLPLQITAIFLAIVCWLFKVCEGGLFSTDDSSVVLETKQYILIMMAGFDKNSFFLLVFCYPFLSRS